MPTENVGKGGSADIPIFTSDGENQTQLGGTRASALESCLTECLLCSTLIQGRAFLESFRSLFRLLLG